MKFCMNQSCSINQHKHIMDLMEDHMIFKLIVVDFIYTMALI